MAHPFDSARAKLARAKEHLEVFQREVSSFLNPNPYPLTHEIDPHTGYHRWRADLTSPMLPSSWPLLVGDFVHNLRSVLDHAAWQLAGAQPNDRTTMFPLFDTEEGFTKHGAWRIARLPPKPRALIESLQPHHRANPRSDTLFLIEVFDREDKHKTIAVPLAGPSQIDVIPTIPPPGGAIQANLSGAQVFDPEPDAVVVEGVVFLSRPQQPPTLYMDVDIEVTFGVAMRAEAAGVTVTLANEDTGLRTWVTRVDEIVSLFDRYV